MNAGRAAEESVAASLASETSSDRNCLECHSDETLTMARGKHQVSLFTSSGILAQSVHHSLSCTDCHEAFDAETIPHQRPMTAVDCVSCHEETGGKHAFHQRLARMPIPRGADTSCTDCHGTHAIAKVSSKDFSFARDRQLEACGKCHLPARDHFLSSAHGIAFRKNAASAPDCLACHDRPVVSAGPTADIALKLAQAKLCESCHVDQPAVAGQTLLGTHFVSSFEQSVHGAALKQGVVGAANCVDCHGAHEMNRAMASSARINKLHVPETCAKCHASIAADFEASVHAMALRKGNRDSPACTNCHGEHDIRAHTDPKSPVYAQNVAQQVCATCHASLRLTQKYGLRTDTFQTFTDSYHGLAVRGGAVEVVNCASCHSAHAIKSKLDPTSTVHKANLVQTCGQCHPGANTRFTVGSVHVSPNAAEGKDGNSPILYLISSVYILLIVVVVGGMFIHNALDFFKKIRRKLALQQGLIAEEHVAHRLYLRMTAHERLQHAVLVLSFVLLVVTGFMLRYPEAWWVVAIHNLSTHAFEWRSLIHRVAGVVLIAAGVWHIAYLAFTPQGRELFRDLLPRKRDFTDPWGVLKYNLGFAAEKPRFGRFSYIEKAEYWALIWGSVLMGATGVILWFENTSMGLLTKLGFDISRTIHFYEAVLATLAIVVWHFYFVIFNPDIYPMNLSWLTGRMSERELLEEHPLELERLKALEAAKAVAKPPASPDRPPTSEPPHKNR